MTLFRSARGREVVDGCFAVNVMPGGLIIETISRLSEIEKFGYLDPNA